MLISMTGFGRAEVALPSGTQAVVEIRTLNHRFMEMETRLPEGLQGYEDSLRAMVADAIHRGRVRVSVAMKISETASPVTFQTALAKRYVNQLRRVKQDLKLGGSVTLETVLGLPQVMVSAKREGALARSWPSLKQGLSRALAHTLKMRRQEGKRLEKVLENLLKTMEGLHRKIRHRAPIAQSVLRTRLTSRIQAALQSTGGAARPTGRSAVAAEAAAWVQSTDVSEELARIASHLTALRQAARGNSGASKNKALAGSPGRTIDFLAQELQREANTLGAKMRDTAVVRWVVAMKGQIEKLREQAANVE